MHVSVKCRRVNEMISVFLCSNGLRMRRRKPCSGSFTPRDAPSGPKKGNPVQIQRRCPSSQSFTSFLFLTDSWSLPPRPPRLGRHHRQVQGPRGGAREESEREVRGVSQMPPGWSATPRRAAGRLRPSGAACVSSGRRGIGRFPRKRKLRGPCGYLVG